MSILSSKIWQQLWRRMTVSGWVGSRRAERPCKLSLRFRLEELESRLAPASLDSWSPAASLNTARFEQTTTLLNDGTVLVAGGNQGSGVNPLASAELYNSTTSWSFTANNMAVARYDASATLLADGRVLVTGGYGASNNALTSAEAYDPTTKTWSSVAPMTTPRYGHTLTLLPGGKVLAAGGANQAGGLNVPLSSAEVYDPGSNSWSAVGSMSSAHYGHTATLLTNGKVLVTGGDVTNTVPTGSAELFDPSHGTWSAAASMATARYSHSATLLGSGKVLVTAGLVTGGTYTNTAEVYDPTSNTWSSAGSIDAPRAWFGAALLGNGEVLIAGGGNATGALATTDIYNPASNSWSVGASLTTARANHSVTALSNGQVLVAGGETLVNSSIVTLSSAELYTAAGPFDVSASTITVSPATINLGSTSTITLTARDSAGTQEVSGGLTVTFGLGTGSTGSGTLSGTNNGDGYTATDNHNGTYTATFTATALGPLTITGKINGQLITSALPTINVVTVASATDFVITSPASATAGAAFSFTVTAKDNSGNTASGYTGTVHFSSSDIKAGLPGDYTFTNGPGLDNGVHTFSATLKTAGLQSLTAADSANALSGQTSIQVSAAAATRFVLSGPTSVAANTLFSITVTALDAYGNVATGYRGTVHITDSSGGSTLPANYTFTASDNGVHTFNGLKLKQKGKHTITVVDTHDGSILGTLVINVT
jgi:N-acetylneuraminic acid mutarotase